MRRVVVVGGGIAGLSAARGLVGSAGGHGDIKVTVLESSSRWGGKVAPVTLDGVRLDAGAESVLARRPEAVALIGELGLGGQLVHPTDAKPRVLVGGRVHSLPPSAMGVPYDLESLAGVLSTEGLLRARQEPDLAAPALTGDVGIGTLVEQRFGPEVTDRLLEPLLGGVYAGRARELSFESVSPGLFRRAQGGGSLLQHARELTAAQVVGPVFAGLDGGVSLLVDALVADLRSRGVTLRTNTAVRELTSMTSGGYRLVCGPVPAPEIIDADAVVLALPAGPAGRLLASVSAEGSELVVIPYASVAVVTLVIRGSGLAGSGLLVPPGELPTIKALTHSSAKWAWVAERALAAWGPGVSVVRASVGRLGEEQLLHVDDDTLLRRTYEEAQTLLEWEGAELLTGHVQRWGGALPQYQVGHTDLVARLRASLGCVPGVAVCGAAYDGVGIAACLASSALAVAKITNDLLKGSQG